MLQNIMKMAADNSSHQFEILSYITQNIANMNTDGFKVRSFENYLTPDGHMEGVQRVNTSQGKVFMTRRPMDLAVQGPGGYIPVTKPDGTTVYTRDGQLARNAQGYLVTAFGDMVGNGIQTPVNYDQLIVDKDGSVKVSEKRGAPPKLIGKIDLVQFANPETLQSIGQNYMVPTAQSGPAQVVPPGTSTIVQGGLERANVDVFGQIEQTLRLNAAAISNFRIIKFADDLYRQSVNLKQ